VLDCPAEGETVKFFGVRLAHRCQSSTLVLARHFYGETA
jgi:hypothetical protein